jgi:hypothetical protein
MMLGGGWLVVLCALLWRSYVRIIAAMAPAQPERWRRLWVDRILPRSRVPISAVGLVIFLAGAYLTVH